MSRTSTSGCCSLGISLLLIALGAPASAFAGRTWSEEYQDDTTHELRAFRDDDEDGNPERASVMAMDGTLMSEWEDTDDDGSWDGCRWREDGVMGEWHRPCTHGSGPRPTHNHDNVMGDLNGDRLVNNFDIDAFVFAVTGTYTQFHSAYPQADMYSGDVNGDLRVDNFDIDAFVECISRGGCGGQAPPTGACCVRQGNVVRCVPGVTQQQCAQMQGLYRGDGTACALVTCPN